LKSIGAPVAICGPSELFLVLRVGKKAEDVVEVVAASKDDIAGRDSSSNT